MEAEPGPQALDGKAAPGAFTPGPLSGPGRRWPTQSMGPMVELRRAHGDTDSTTDLLKTASDVLSLQADGQTPRPQGGQRPGRLHL